MTSHDPIVYVAPFIWGSVLAEAVHLRGTPRAYTARRLASALGCLSYDYLVGAATVVVFLGAFAAIHARVGATVFDAPAGAGGVVLGVVVAVLLHDFLYYAYHRLAHRVNVLWAAHVVHHQSRYLDFTVSLRQGSLGILVTSVFYLPMALVVPPWLFIGVHAAYQVWQFFVHTEVVGRLGLVEWFLVTPSHHRVHHGINDAYLDRNFGGFLIVFDKLFGTFAPERERPDYGVRDGFNHASPGVANLFVLGRLLRLSSEVRGVRGLVRLWFGPPEAVAGLMTNPPASRRDASIGAYVAVAAGLLLSTVAIFAPVALTVRIAVGVLAVAVMEAGFNRLGSETARI